MEAKNVIHSDFLVRQLYYPFRVYKNNNRITKDIRLVFSIYSNQIYRLYEYKFNTLNDYSSIDLVQKKYYSLQDTNITLDDLKRVRNETSVTTDDNMNISEIPFPQANSFDRVINLLDNLKKQEMTRAEILEFMGLDMRQIDYYCCAGKYLKIFNKERKDKKVSVFLTPLGKLLSEMKYKEKQLTLISLILEHQIFADCFDETINNNNVIPETDFTATKLLQLNTCSDSVSKRRAATVRRWLHWIFNLVQL